MDHIPNIQNPVYPHVEVAYLPDEKYPYIYDNKGFAGFPERNGWDSNLFLSNNFSFNGVEEHERAAAFLQAWLYFGLMGEVFQTPINTTDFISHKNGTKLVTTRKLQSYIDAWQDRALTATPEENENRISRLDSFLRNNFIYFDACIQDDPDVWPRTSPLPLPVEVQLSIAVLYATLLKAKLHIFCGSSYQPVGYSNQLIVNRLREDGWCGSDIKLLTEGAFGVSSILDVYHASLLGPRHRRVDHGKCSDVICLGYQTGEDRYVTKHRDECGGGCAFVDVPPERLAAVISRKRVPLVMVVGADGDANPTVSITEASPYVKYVAISHVYADGLGNRRACALPRCQLERIQQRVNDLYAETNTLAESALSKNIPFWMDTLCIPVQKEYMWHRAIAITQMAETYEKASHVLVLNAEFELASRNALSEESFRRIASCNWFRRLWTLQEGVLAKDVYFQFGDGALGMAEQMQETWARSITEGNIAKDRFSVPKILRREASNPYVRLRSFGSVAPRERIRSLYEATQWRATTHKRDEAVCFGTLLGLDTRPIVNAKDSERMKELIKAQRHFPVQALFFTEPRLGISEPGYGWFIRNFLLRIGPEAIKPESLLAVADEDGLHVALAGFTFNADAFPDTTSGGEFKFDFTFLNEATKTWYQVSTGFWLADPNRPGSWKEILERYQTKELAVVIESWEEVPLASPAVDTKSLLGPRPLETALFDENWMETFMSNLRNIQAPPPTRGALVAVKKHGGDEISARFCGVVIVSQLVKQYSISDMNPEPSASGVILGPEQKWCVG